MAMSDERAAQLRADSAAPGCRAAVFGSSDDTKQWLQCDFYRFMEKREKLRIRKDVRNLPESSWSEDPVLMRTRLTNVRREHDRTTRVLRAITDGLRSEWLELATQGEARVRDGIRSPQIGWTRGQRELARLLVFNCALWRAFGTIAFSEAVGFQRSWDDAAQASVVKLAMSMWRKGIWSFTDAYQPARICRNAEKGAYSWDCADAAEDLYRGACARLRAVWAVAGDVAKEIERSRSWRRATITLMQARGYGGTGFLAKEVVQDLLHTVLFMEQDESGQWLTHCDDVNHWCAVGPGARRGLNRLKERSTNFGIYDGSRNTAQVFLSELMQLFDLRDEMWPETIECEDAGELGLHDVQFQLCEYDKYSRARKGEGPVRRYVSFEQLDRLPKLPIGWKVRLGFVRKPKSVRNSQPRSSKPRPRAAAFCNPEPGCVMSLSTSEGHNSKEDWTRSDGCMDRIRQRTRQTLQNERQRKEARKKSKIALKCFWKKKPKRRGLEAKKREKVRKPVNRDSRRPLRREAMQRSQWSPMQEAQMQDLAKALDGTRSSLSCNLAKALDGTRSSLSCRPRNALLGHTDALGLPVPVDEVQRDDGMRPFSVGSQHQLAAPLGTRQKLVRTDFLRSQTCVQKTVQYELSDLRTTSVDATLVLSSLMDAKVSGTGEAAEEAMRKYSRQPLTSRLSPRLSPCTSPKLGVAEAPSLVAPRKRLSSWSSCSSPAVCPAEEPDLLAPTWKTAMVAVSSQEQVDVAHQFVNIFAKQSPKAKARRKQ